MSEYNSVLIIEDDKILAESLGKSFAKRNYEVRVANNGSEALEIIKNFYPKYAVIDLKMPGISGLECVKKLHEFSKAIKIVMLTGYASISTTVEAIKNGACYYLAKPANVDDIIAAFRDEASSKIAIKKTSIKNLEWEYINKTLMDVDFNVSKAAKILGMHRRTLARKLEKKFID
jgi:two-component system response regulator RegA